MYRHEKFAADVPEVAQACTSCYEAQFKQVRRVLGRPVLGGVASTVETQVEPGYVVFVAFFPILGGNLYVHGPGCLCIEVCSAHVKRHDSVGVFAELVARAN